MAKANTNVSIVDYLNSQGQDSSYSARKKLATEMGITNYSGTPSQNTQMLNALKSGESSTKSNNDVKITPSNPAASVPIKGDTADVSKTAEETKQDSSLLGVPQDLLDVAESKYNPSDAVTQSNKNRENALGNLSVLTSKDQIVSDSVWSALGSSFTVPSEVREADAYLASQLEKIQSGRTSYTDQVKEMMDKIMNREKFTYDVDTDPLFQQALASAMNSGKQAMQDTIGQASALTGGYGSTYATTAGNQAYNAFIEDAYDNLPQYYQLAMEAYQMEGDEMYRQFGMLSELDDKEYNRNVTAYDVTAQYRNRLYDESYTQFRDSKTDAYNMANLQITEHGQLVSDAYNYYSAVSDYSDSLYEREYGAWADSVNQAIQLSQIYNTDAWSEKNFNYKEEWDNKMFDYQKDRDAVADEQWAKSYALEEKLTNAQIAKMNSSGGGGGGDNSGGGGLGLTSAQLTAAKKANIEAGGGEAGFDAAVRELAAMGVYVDSNNAGILMSALEDDVLPESPKVASGVISGFKTKTNDNFDVTVGDESYRVENHGKVSDKNTINAMNKVNVDNNSAFLYDGAAYVKYDNNYYKVGATNILWKETDGYKKLVSALKK